MATYLYAICAEQVSAPEGPGLDDAPLRVVSAAGLSAVVSDAPDMTGAPSESLLWAHERVVERLMSEHDVLPARFGSVLADDAAVAGMLEARHSEWLAALRRVAGARELAVRAAWEPEVTDDLAPTADRGDGAEYLMSRVAAQRRSRDLAERIDETLGAVSRESRVRGGAVSASMPVRAAYLVDRERVDEFRSCVEGLERELRGAEIVCTGPWPPYSFVAAEESRS
jgi:hypothetical protein